MADACRPNAASPYGPRARSSRSSEQAHEVYPIVPIADQHAVSIGMTTINDRAFFGVYADCKSLPDSDVLSIGIGKSIDELLALS